MTQRGVQRSSRTAEQRVTRPIAKEPSLQAIAEQTRASWAKSVTFYDQVPEAFKDFFKTLLGNTSTWPYTVLMPTYEGFMRRENGRLICNLGDKIYVMERARNKTTCTCYPIEDISYVEEGVILLYAWVKISGIASDGVPSSSMLKFNAVTDYLLAPIIEKIRPATAGLEDADRNLELAKFDYLARLNFKFMSYGRHSILPGEKVIHTVLQSEIREKIFTVLGRSVFRTVSTAHISILTDRELILIRDEEQSQWSRDARYGGTRSYIPLNKITSVSLTRNERDLFDLSIHLPGNDQIVSLFSISNERELDLFLNRLESVASGVTQVRNGPHKASSGQLRPVML
jgi:hypothetical protein